MFILNKQTNKQTNQSQIFLQVFIAVVVAFKDTVYAFYYQMLCNTASTRMYIANSKFTSTIENNFAGKLL